MTESRSAEVSPTHEDWIDLARAVCCVGVCLLHTFTGFVMTTPGVQPGAPRLALWGVVRLVLGRFAVPCFLMITGYLVLDPAREMGLRKVGSHLLRLAGLVLTFGWAFAVVECAYDAGGFSFGAVGEGLVRALTGRSWDHLWYLYVLILLYVTMPLWRWVVTLPRRCLAAVILALACLCAAVFALLETGAEGLGALWLLVPAPLYLLVGGYTRRHVRARPVWLRPLGVASLCAACTLLVGQTLGRGMVVPYLEDYGCPLVSLWSLVVFDGFRWADLGRLRGRAWDVVRVLSRDSLGIYVLHPIATNLLYKGLGLTPLAMPVGYVIVVWFIEVAFALVATEVLRRLPLFRSLL